MPTAPPLSHVETWVFDLDNTLYSAGCRLFEQIEQRMMTFICELLSVDDAEAHRLRRTYLAAHGTTLRGLMVHHGLDPAHFLEYVHAIDLAVIPPAPALDAALHALEGRKLIFTNGTVRHAEAVLERLGIAHHFEAVYDVAAAGYVPKPAPAIYHDMVARHRVDPRVAAMFEDSARNLVPACALGMTTILVEHELRPDDGTDPVHVHYRTEDIAGWLGQVVTARGVAAPPS